MLSTATKTTFVQFDQELVKREIIETGYSLKKGDFFKLNKDGLASFAALADCWNHLGPDPYYKGKEGCYRVRKYSDFFFDPKNGSLQRCNHVPYFQSLKMNSYVGGKKRDFEDVDAVVYSNPFFIDLVAKDFLSLPIEEKYLNEKWICQIHMIRIVVGADLETPVTPEGIHSDGYPFAGVHFIGKTDNLLGGESSVYTYEEKPLVSATFSTPLDALYLEDRKMKHYVSPIRAKGKQGHRDILAISFSLPGSPYYVER